MSGHHLPDADAELEAVDGARAVGVQNLSQKN